METDDDWGLFLGSPGKRRGSRAGSMSGTPRVLSPKGTSGGGGGMKSGEIVGGSGGGVLLPRALGRGGDVEEREEEKDRVEEEEEEGVEENVRDDGKVEENIKEEPVEMNREEGGNVVDNLFGGVERGNDEDEGFNWGLEEEDVNVDDGEGLWGDDGGDFEVDDPDTKMDAMGVDVAPEVENADNEKVEDVEPAEDFRDESHAEELETALEDQSTIAQQVTEPKQGVKDEDQEFIEEEATVTEEVKPSRDEEIAVSPRNDENRSQNAEETTGEGRGVQSVENKPFDDQANAEPDHPMEKENVAYEYHVLFGSGNEIEERPQEKTNNIPDIPDIPDGADEINDDTTSKDVEIATTEKQNDDTMEGNHDARVEEDTAVHAEVLPGSAELLSSITAQTNLHDDEMQINDEKVMSSENIEAEHDAELQSASADKDVAPVDWFESAANILENDSSNVPQPGNEEAREEDQFGFNVEKDEAVPTDADDSKREVSSPVNTTSFDTGTQNEEENLEKSFANMQIASKQGDNFDQSGEIPRPSKAQDVKTPHTQNFAQESLPGAEQEITTTGDEGTRNESKKEATEGKIENSAGIPSFLNGWEGAGGWDEDGADAWDDGDGWSDDDDIDVDAPEVSTNENTQEPLKQDSPPKEESVAPKSTIPATKGEGEENDDIDLRQGTKGDVVEKPVANESSISSAPAANSFPFSGGDSGRTVVKSEFPKGINSRVVADSTLNVPFEANSAVDPREEARFLPQSTLQSGSEGEKVMEELKQDSNRGDNSVEDVQNTVALEESFSAKTASPVPDMSQDAVGISFIDGEKERTGYSEAGEEVAPATEECENASDRGGESVEQPEAALIQGAHKDLGAGDEERKRFADDNAFESQNGFSEFPDDIRGSGFDETSSLQTERGSCVHSLFTEDNDDVEDNEDSGKISQSLPDLPEFPANHLDSQETLPNGTSDPMAEKALELEQQYVHDAEVTAAFETGTSHVEQSPPNATTMEESNEVVIASNSESASYEVDGGGKQVSVERRITENDPEDAMGDMQGPENPPHSSSLPFNNLGTEQRIVEEDQETRKKARPPTNTGESIGGTEDGSKGDGVGASFDAPGEHEGQNGFDFADWSQSVESSTSPASDWFAATAPSPEIERASAPPADFVEPLSAAVQPAHPPPPVNPIALSQFDETPSAPPTQASNPTSTDIPSTDHEGSAPLEGLLVTQGVPAESLKTSEASNPSSSGPFAQEEFSVAPQDSRFEAYGADPSAPGDFEPVTDLHRRKSLEGHGSRTSDPKAYSPHPGRHLASEEAANIPSTAAMALPGLVSQGFAVHEQVNTGSLLETNKGEQVKDYPGHSQMFLEPESSESMQGEAYEAQQASDLFASQSSPMEHVSDSFALNPHNDFVGSQGMDQGELVDTFQNAALVDDEDMYAPKVSGGGQQFGGPMEDKAVFETGHVPLEQQGSLYEAQDSFRVGVPLTTDVSASFAPKSNVGIGYDESQATHDRPKVPEDSRSTLNDTFTAPPAQDYHGYQSDQQDTPYPANTSHVSVSEDNSFMPPQPPGISFEMENQAQQHSKPAPFLSSGVEERELHPHENYGQPTPMSSSATQEAATDHPLMEYSDSPNAPPLSPSPEFLPLPQRFSTASPSRVPMTMPEEFSYQPKTQALQNEALICDETDLLPPQNAGFSAEADYTSAPPPSIFQPQEMFQFSIMDSTLPSSDRPPRASFSFGFGGKIVTTMPGNAQNVKIYSLGKFAEQTNHPDWMAVSAYPGTKSDSKPGEGAAIYAAMCDTLASRAALYSRESKSAMWSVLAALCRGQSALAGIKPPEMRVSTRGGYINDTREDETEKETRPFSSLSTVESRALQTDIEKLLCSGDTTGALNKAIENRQFGIALVLASAIGRDAYQSTIAQFGKAALGEGSALQTLMLSVAGSHEMAASLACADGTRGWRRQLAVLAATPGREETIVELGRVLMGKGDVLAGHLCWLAADKYDFNLLGYGKESRRAVESLEFVLSNVVYERLNVEGRVGRGNILKEKEDPKVPSTLPLRLLVVRDLIDVGRLDDALHECESIVAEVKEWAAGKKAGRIQFTAPFLATLEEMEHRLRIMTGKQDGRAGTGRLGAMVRSFSSKVFGKSTAPLPNMATHAKDRGHSFTSAPLASNSQIRDVDHKRTASWDPSSVISKTLNILAPADGDLSPIKAQNGTPYVDNMNLGPNRQQGGSVPLVGVHHPPRGYQGVGFSTSQTISNQTFNGGPSFTENSIPSNGPGSLVGGIGQGSRTQVAMPFTERPVVGNEQLYTSTPPKFKDDATHISPMNTTRSNDGPRLGNARSASLGYLPSALEERNATRFDREGSTSLASPLAAQSLQRDNVNINQDGDVSDRVSTASEPVTSSNKPPRPPSKRRSWLPFNPGASVRGWMMSKFGGKKQAHLGGENKFYYNEELKMWIEEGVDPQTVSAGPPPPPSDHELSGVVAPVGTMLNDAGPLRTPQAAVSSHGEPEVLGVASQLPKPSIPGRPAIPQMNGQIREPGPSKYRARAKGVRASRYANTPHLPGSNANAAKPPPIPGAQFSRPRPAGASGAAKYKIFTPGKGP